MTCIEDIFGGIVKDIRTNDGLTVYFHFGTLNEIVDNLNSLTSAGADKYPLIALIEPFKQQKELLNIDSRPVLRFLIATYTEQNLKAGERLELNFKRVLFPLYDSFVRHIKQSEYFRMDRLEHTVINHFELGRQTLAGYDGNIFNDHIDAIELTDMKLDVKHKQCKIKNF